MQLPAPQLLDALTICSELKQPLREHLINLTEGQRTHIPAAIQDMIMGTSLQHSLPPTSILPPPIQTSIETSDDKVYLFLLAKINIQLLFYRF